MSDQYATARACEVIAGYYLPRQLVSREENFKRAKADAVKKLRQALADVEACTFEDFDRHTDGGRRG